jgi:hypothetical protein
VIATASSPENAEGLWSLGVDHADRLPEGIRMGMSFHLFCRMPLKYIGSAKYCRSATSFGFEATFGDYNWHGLQGAINIPIVDG